MIRPLHDYLVLKPETKPGMIGAIHIPDFGNLKDKTSAICTVLAAGPKCVLAKVGDRVHVTAYGAHVAGIEIVHEGQQLVLNRERDINGVVCEEKKGIKIIEAALYPQLLLYKIVFEYDDKRYKIDLDSWEDSRPTGNGIINAIKQAISSGSCKIKPVQS